MLLDDSVYMLLFPVQIDRKDAGLDEYAVSMYGSIELVSVS